MTVFYLIRHGQTNWNKEKRIQGHLDIGLSAEGKRQAHLLGQALAGEDIQYIYASDLSRAHDTAKIISQYIKVPVSGTFAGLREINFGNWAGMSFTEIAAADPETLAWWRQDTVTRPVPGGESFQMMADRVMNCIHDLKEKHPQAKIAVVSHGGPIIYALGIISNLSIEERRKLRVINCSITVIEYNHATDAWTVERINDVCHLVSDDKPVQEGTSY